MTGIGGWAELAVTFDDDRSHFLNRFSFLLHFHHVTRDIDADPSASSMAVELEHIARPAVISHVTTVVRRVANSVAAAETGDLLQQFLVGDGKAVGLFDLGRGVLQLGWQSRCWRQFDLSAGRRSRRLAAASGEASCDREEENEKKEQGSWSLQGPSHRMEWVRQCSTGQDRGKERAPAIRRFKVSGAASCCARMADDFTFVGM